MLNEYYLYRKQHADREEAERRACKHLIEQESLARQGAGNEKAQPHRLRFRLSQMKLLVKREDETQQANTIFVHSCAE